MNSIRKPFVYSFFNATLILIIANITVFAILKMIPYLVVLLSMTPVLVLRGCLWQFVTYMFAHANFEHLLFNMIALFVFGVRTERYMGSKEFLVYYFFTGILAGIFSFAIFLFTGGTNIHLLGASGAIFAVQLAYAAFFPDSLIYIWGILPVRAPLLVLIFSVIELGSMVFRVQNGVAHLTHLAGVGFGWLYFLVRYSANPLRMMVRRR